VEHFFFFFLETGSHYVVQAGLELMLLLAQLPQCWEYRYAPPCWTFLVPFNSNLLLTSNGHIFKHKTVCLLQVNFLYASFQSTINCRAVGNAEVKAEVLIATVQHHHMSHPLLLLISILGTCFKEELP
jgi:hypothetical protein